MPPVAEPQLEAAALVARANMSAAVRIFHACAAATGAGVVCLDAFCEAVNRCGGALATCVVSALVSVPHVPSRSTGTLGSERGRLDAGLQCDTWTLLICPRNSRPSAVTTRPPLLREMNLF